MSRRALKRAPPWRRVIAGAGRRTRICALHKTHINHKPDILYVRQPAAPARAVRVIGAGTRHESDRSWMPMSLLTWERPRARKPGASALVAAQQIAAQQSPAGELTPLRMTLVGAMLIAVGPI